jgi:hypothetical protein
MLVHVLEDKVTEIPVALNLAGKQSEAADLLKHLAENAVTENRYDKIDKATCTVVLGRIKATNNLITDLVMLATTTGYCVGPVWKLQKRNAMVCVHVLCVWRSPISRAYIHVDQEDMQLP